MEAIPAANRHFSYWRVNGETLTTAGLTLAIEKDTRVTVIFGIDGIPDENPVAKNNPQAGEGGGGCFMESLSWQY